jgi:hypothetical protein
MARKGERVSSAERRIRPATPEPEAKGAAAERLLAQLDEKIRLLALVNGVLRTAVSAASISELIAVFASNLKESVPFDRLSVALADPAARVFHVPFIYFRGRVEENKESPRPYADTPLSKVLETGQPMLRKNIGAEMTFARDREFVQKGLGCEMIFPLIAGASAFGTYQMSCFEPGRLTERHLAVVSDLIPAITIVTHRFIEKKT